MRGRALVAVGLTMLACRTVPRIPAFHAYVSDGHTRREIDTEHRPELERALLAVLSSCAVDSSASAGTADDWRTAEAGPAIVAHYTGPDPVATVQGEIEIDSIVFPLPSPDTILARRADTIYAFSKWSPRLEARLVCAPHLGLEHYARIRALCDALGEDE